jgi:hypothetical protein
MSQPFNRLRHVANTAVFAAFILTTIGLPARAWADDDNKSAYFPDARPFSVALSNADWSVRWWTWALTIPNETNPTLDLTSVNCGVGAVLTDGEIGWRPADHRFRSGEILKRRSRPVPARRPSRV